VDGPVRRPITQRSCAVTRPRLQRAVVVAPTMTDPRTVQGGRTWGTSSNCRSGVGRQHRHIREAARFPRGRVFDKHSCPRHPSPPTLLPRRRCPNIVRTFRTRFRRRRTLGKGRVPPAFRAFGKSRSCATAARKLAQPARRRPKLRPKRSPSIPSTPTERLARNLPKPHETS
jgi:hypothetical protein